MPETNDIFEIMSTMRAMRRLKPDPVPDELINKILQAGQWAPSGGNTQRWRFLVVKDPDRLEVLLGDRVLEVPARIRPALEEVRRRPELRPRDLPLDEQSRLVLARRLVREGLLRVVPE